MVRSKLFFIYILYSLKIGKEDACVLYGSSKEDVENIFFLCSKFQMLKAKVDALIGCYISMWGAYHGAWLDYSSAY